MLVTIHRPNNPVQAMGSDWLRAIKKFDPLWMITTSRKRPERSGDPERNVVEPKDCRAVEGCDSKPDSTRETHPSTAPCQERRSPLRVLAPFRDVLMMGFELLSEAEVRPRTKPK